jgi:hypothetical protein
MGRCLLLLLVEQLAFTNYDGFSCHAFLASLEDELDIPHPRKN